LPVFEYIGKANNLALNTKVGGKEMKSKKDKRKNIRIIGALVILGMLVMMASTPSTVAITWAKTYETESRMIIIDYQDTVPDDEEAFAIAHDDSEEILLIVLEDGGKVGIGTDTPDVKFDVELSGTPGSVGGAATIGSSGNSATGDYAIAMGYDTTASGYWSTAMGKDTTASWNYATAMGFGTTASNGYSTAMGSQTTASGIRSTAMGYDTTASGDTSTAMGYQTNADGVGSTAMGYQTYANGLYSTAMGSKITAQGSYTFGIGLDSTATTISQSNTMAIMGGKVGIGTVSPGSTLVVKGEGYSSGTSAMHVTDSRDASLLFIQNDGKIGIGETAPNFKLDIAGSSGSGYFGVSSATIYNGDIFIIDSNGKVGIGITSPSRELTVDGIIRATNDGTLSRLELASASNEYWVQVEDYFFDGIGFYESSSEAW
jgi:hypothetical protein